jgi:hypothetical protein
MFSSLAYFIVALVLASSILVSAIPLSPITIESYPSPREPLLENNNHDVFEVMTFEAIPAAQIAEGCLQNKRFPTFTDVYLRHARWICPSSAIR